MRLIIGALFLGFLFSALAPPVQAQSEEDHVAYVVGTGGMQCGTILERIEEGKELQQGLVWKAMTLSWMQGFLSGINQVVPPTIKVDLLGGFEGHHRWTIKYCEENPLDSYMDAVIALRKELYSRQHPE